MLHNTFIHIQGIGLKTEQNLWQRGILTWDDFSRCEETIFSPARDRLIREDLRLSMQHQDDVRFFSTRLPSSETWRLFGTFRHRSAYLDIETSGGYDGLDEITVIGLYDGVEAMSFVSGRNLECFEAAVSAYDLLVTFNGSLFDLPFIRRTFPHICLPPAHVDLRFLLKRLGLSGGLKRIEKTLGLAREEGIDGMTGYDAVLLWQAWRLGDGAALERLLAYNRADIINLEPLMELAYAAIKAQIMPEASL